MKRKLTISDPGDASEREADRIADRVVEMSDQESAEEPLISVSEARIHRTCSRCQQRNERGLSLDCEDCEREIRRSNNSDGATLDLERAASVVDRPGQQLTEGTRSFFERRFGRDFSNIRIHTGGRADQAARSIHAQAFVLGHDVVFRSGEYRPDTREGTRLLAHELSHVVQEGGPRRIGRPPHLRGDAPAELADGTPYSVEQFRVSGRSGTASERVIARQESPDTDDQERIEEANDILREAGYTEGDPKGVIHIAWTMDDGPTRFTGRMDETLGARPTTWFIQRNNLGEGTIERLKERQQAGDEIAIHSMHRTVDHVCWFPTSNGCNRGYDTTREAMDDLVAFVNELRNEGIRISFVRLPTGLFSELVYYLRDEGSDDPRGEARKIVNAANESKTIPDLSEAGKTVFTDLTLVLKALKEHDLHLWGGGEDEVPALSWEAEASGIEQREDNIRVKFRWAVDQITAGNRKSVSFVVLAHDTSSADVTRVGQHIEWMENFATAKQILIRYHQKAELYEEIRGKKP